jgi:hypothetical protein
MPGTLARRLIIPISIGALCLWANPAQSRFGGGGHFGGGGFGHFGGGGMHFGGMRFGGAHFGGMRFGGARFGGARFGGARFGGARFGGARFGGRHFGATRFARHHSGGMHFAHRSSSHHAMPGHRSAGAAGRQAARHMQSAHRVTDHSTRLAHAALAGAGLHQIHGFRNFNHHPFNRNGFGNRFAWNHFQRKFFHHCCGWFGPVFWPFFIGDVFTAVLWPWDVYDPFWYYGSDYILSSIFWAGYGGGPSYAARDVYDIYGNGTPRYGNGAPRRSASSQSERIDGANGPAARAAFNEACIGFAPDVMRLPVSRIQREVQPIGDQLAAFEELQAALTKADEIIKASCSNEVPLTPIKRLEVVQARLNAMADVVRTMKGPLSEFYNSLSETQRQRFDAVRGEGASHGPRARMASGNGLAALCSERAAAFSDVPAQRIEETIRPTPEQRSAFDALKTAAAKAGDGLRSSCPAQMPTSIMDRLDAVDARLAAMLSAVEIVRPALEGFYASLTDEQKARFNAFGEPQRQAGATSG